MFDDILTSSRGPGVIGTFLAVFVLAGFCGLGMMVLNSDPVGPAPGAEVAEQKDRIEEYTEKIADKVAELSVYDDFHSKIPERNLQAKLVEMRQQRLETLRENLANEKLALTETDSSFEKYKNRYRKNERELARGEVLDLSSIRGDRYKKCRILSVDALGIRVGISSGPKGVSSDELPKDLQDRFQFDPDEASAYRDAVGMMEKQKEITVAKLSKEKKAQKTAKLASERGRLISKKRREIQTKQSQHQRKISAARSWEAKASQYEQKIRAAKATGRISIDPSNAKTARVKAKRLRHSAAKIDRDISRLLSEIRELQRKSSK